MRVKFDLEKYIEPVQMKSFGKGLSYWVDCQRSGAIYKKPYSLASIETNLRLIKHYLKNLKPDYSNIENAYIKTKIDTAWMKSKSQIRLHNTVISFVKSLFKGGME